MATVETRAHLGPNEVEIDSDLFGIMLIPDNGTAPVMSLKVFSDKERALLRAKEFKTSRAVVVTIKGTNA